MASHDAFVSHPNSWNYWKPVAVQLKQFSYHFVSSLLSLTPAQSSAFFVCLLFDFLFFYRHFMISSKPCSLNLCWLNFAPPTPSLLQALESVQFLCKVQGLDSVMELYRQHMGQLLDWLSASVNTWSSYSPERLQLHIVVIQSGESWSLYVCKM